MRKAAALALLVLGSLGAQAANAQGGFKLTLDKTDYNVGETIVMKTAFPKDFQPGWHGWFATPVAGLATFDTPADCDWGEAQRGMACKFSAPDLNGTYDVQFRETSGHGLVLAAVRITVKSKPSPESIGTFPARVVIGEVFDINLNFPAGRYYAPESNWNGPNLRLYRITKANQTWEEKEVEKEWLDAIEVGDTSKGHARVSMKAPAEPCVCELRLYDRYPHDQNGRPAGYLLAVKPLGVVVGQVNGAIGISRDRFTSGEAIDLTVTLPANRFYQTGWGGPTVRLIPKEINGVRLDEKAAQQAYEDCGAPCATELESLAAGDRIERVAEYGILPGRYKPRAIIAPQHSGTYELRLYGQASGGHAFSSREVHIDAVSPVILRFVRQERGGLVQLPSLEAGDKYQIQARYEQPQLAIQETFALLNTPGQLPKYIALKKVSDDTFISDEQVFLPNP
jgi:hypothetical protein